ncbi:MAG: aspartate kinase, partial [Elusimicrobiota bacterium]
MKRPPLTVMKFGGTSVADPEKIQRAAERAVAARKRGHRVVVVVSAPGQMTDELTALAQRIDDAPDARELDVLLSTGELVGISLFTIACWSRGAPAISLSGPQAGIYGDEHHTRSMITNIKPSNILRELDEGKIVAVAGFQAANPRGELTTLGRGGSDLSAVALAAVLKADQCEIYTDVKGVYTADPRLVPQARKIARLSYEEMLELSSAGAQVMLARSIEMAKRHGVRIHVRSAFYPVPGTWIEPIPEGKMEQANVSSLAVDKDEVRLSIVEVPDKPGVAAKVLTALAKRDIPIDLIIQSAPTQNGVNDISFMTPRCHTAAARKALTRLQKELGAKRVDVHDQVVKLTAVGTGFRRHPEVAAKMFNALAKSRINIHMISTSDLKICCVIDRRHADNAVRLLHKAFSLGRR